MVQTDGLVLLPTHAASVLELKYTETETEEGLKEQFSANVTIEKNPQEDTETCAGEHLIIVTYSMITKTLLI